MLRQAISITHDYSTKIIEVVRDTARKTADALHVLRLMQLPFQMKQVRHAVPGGDKARGLA
jgi:hypothetical protein